MLSEAVYRMLRPSEFGQMLYVNNKTWTPYQAGTIVRLIDGIDGSNRPGYHFNDAYCTVCRIDAKHAEFVGIKKCDLELVQGNSPETWNVVSLEGVLT